MVLGSSRFTLALALALPLALGLVPPPPGASAAVEATVTKDCKDTVEGVVVVGVSDGMPEPSKRAATPPAEGLMAVVEVPLTDNFSRSVHLVAVQRQNLVDAGSSGASSSGTGSFFSR